MAWTDRIVPFTVESVRDEVHGRDLGVGDLVAHRIPPPIEPAGDRETLGGGRRGDQPHNRFVIAQRFTAPVRADEGEQAMFHLVPFARPGRKVADPNGETRLIGQGLQLHLPLPEPIAVTAPTIGRDQHAPRVGIQSPAFGTPPPADRRHGKRAGIVVGADIHESGVASQVVDAIRIRAGHRGRGKIMHGHLHRRLGPAPLLARILVVAEEFLLLRIDRDHGALRPQRLPDLAVDEPKLRIAVRVVRAFLRLSVRLQAVLHAPQQLGNRLVTDRMPVRRQFGRERPRALNGPAERRLWIPTRQRVHQRLQPIGQRRIAQLQHRASSARAAHAAEREGRLVQLVQPLGNRDARQPTRATHRRDASSAELARFARGKQAPCPLVQMRPQLPDSLLQGALIAHLRKILACPWYVKVIY